MPATTLITVAPTGAESRVQDNAALPVAVDDLVAAARSCQQAGAAMVHIHVRDGQQRPTLDRARLTEAVAAIRAETELVVQLSTGGAVWDDQADRLAGLDAAPDSCSLATGTVNFGDEVFHNPWPFVTELYRRTQERGILPEFELFDLGHVAALKRLLDDYGPPAGGHVHADFVLGVPGGMPGTAQALVAGVAMLPRGATWSASGIGRSSVPVLLAALSMGGHARVGMEDTWSYGRRQPVQDNTQLVARAARLAAEAFRAAASVAEARRMLGLTVRGPA